MYAPKSALASAAASARAAAASKAASSTMASPPAATARPSTAARAARHGAGLGVTADAHAATRHHVASHAAATRDVASGAPRNASLRVTAAHAVAESAAYDPASVNAARSAAFRVSSYSSRHSSANVSDVPYAPHVILAAAARKHDASAVASARSPPPPRVSFLVKGSVKSACARTSAFAATASGTTRLAMARRRYASGTIVAGDACNSVSGPSARWPPKYTRACSRRSASPHAVTSFILVRNANAKGAVATADTPAA